MDVEGHPNTTLDAMSRALRWILQSSFSEEIEGNKMPCYFIHPSFTNYNKKMDLVEHVSHFTQLMAFYS